MSVSDGGLGVVDEPLGEDYVEEPTALPRGAAGYALARELVKYRLLRQVRGRVEKDIRPYRGRGRAPLHGDGVPPRRRLHDTSLAGVRRGRDGEGVSDPQGAEEGLGGVRDGGRHGGRTSFGTPRRRCGCLTRAAPTSEAAHAVQEHALAGVLREVACGRPLVVQRPREAALQLLTQRFDYKVEPSEMS